MTIDVWIDLAASLGLDGLDFGQVWFRDLRPATIATLKCRKLGGRAGFPSLEETRAFIRESGPDLLPASHARRKTDACLREKGGT